MRTISVVLIALACAANVSAQRQLERADSLLNSGDYGQARQLVLEWQRANPANGRTDAAQLARALYLSARLTEDGAQAQELYLTLSLTYPTSVYAPEALLRLGQGLLAANENRRALAYLERLVSDYPTAPVRTQGQLWLARAQIATGNRRAACATVGTALKGNVTGETAALLQAEERSICANADAARPPETTTPAVSTPAPERKTAPSATNTKANTPVEVSAPRTEPKAAPSAAGARFAVQSGAFRNVQSATTISNALKKQGFDARVAYMPTTDLAYVRIGRFSSRNEAVNVAARAKAAGFNAIIVDDAHREKER